MEGVIEVATERETAADAYKAFVDSGFVLVEREPRLSGLPRDSRPDLVAWAANGAGSLAPWAVAEVRAARKDWRPELEGPGLARLRDRLGTVDHYVVSSDGTWYRADGALQSFEPVDGPSSPPEGGDHVIDDARLVEDLLSSRLWRAADRARGSMSADGYQTFVAEELESLTSLRTEEGVEIPITAEARWRAVRASSVAFATRTPAGAVSTSDPTVTAAVAQLAATRLDGTLVDPSCGLGTFLWECIDVARARDLELTRAIGYEINIDTQRIASAIGAAAAIPVEIHLGDALTMESPQADAVVSAPPLGTPLQEPYRLLDGRETRLGDLAFLDFALRSVAPGGRAVLHMGTGLTYLQAAAPYREFLANEFRIAALIGLPSGAVSGSGIPSIILVIERGEPTDTFVAQLGEDWREQLAAGGAALEAALLHVDGGASK